METRGSIIAISVNLYHHYIRVGKRFYERREWIEGSPSSIKGEEVLIKTNQDIFMQGVRIASIKDLGLYAKGNIILGEAKNYMSYEFRTTKRKSGLAGWLGGKKTIIEKVREIKGEASKLEAGGRININSGANTRMIGTQIHGQEVRLRAGSVEQSASISILPNVMEKEYYLQTEESSFSWKRSLVGWEVKNTKMRIRTAEVMPTVIRVEDEFLVYSKGEYRQISSKVMGNIIKIDARKIEIGIAPNLESRFVHVTKNGIGLGFKANLDELSVRLGASFERIAEEVEKVDYGVRSEIIGDFVELKADELRDYGARYQANMLNMYSRMSIHGIGNNIESLQRIEEKGEAGIKFGIRSNIGSLIRSISNINPNNKSLAGLVNNGFAGLQAYENFLLLKSGGGIEIGGYGYSKYQKKIEKEIINRPIPTEIKAEELQEIIEERLTLEGTQYEIYRGYIKTKYLSTKGAKVEIKKMLKQDEYDIAVPLTGEVIPSLGGVQGEMNEEKVVNWNARIMAVEDLVLEVEGHADLHGIYISAKSLEASFDSLVLASAVDYARRETIEKGMQVDLDNLFKSSVNGRRNFDSKHIVAEISALLGSEHAKVVVRNALWLSGAMIANAEVGDNGSYADHGNLQLSVGELFAEHIKLYDQGKTLGAAVQMGMLNKDRSVFGSVMAQYRDIHATGQASATIGRGDVKIGGSNGDAKMNESGMNREVDQALRMGFWAEFQH